MRRHNKAGTVAPFRVLWKHQARMNKSDICHIQRTIHCLEIALQKDPFSVSRKIRAASKLSYHLQTGTSSQLEISDSKEEQIRTTPGQVLAEVAERKAKPKTAVY